MAVSTRPSRPRPQSGPAADQRRDRPARHRGEGRAGYLFLTPWLLGFAVITAIPMLMSLYLSFTNYDILSPFSEVTWVGWANYDRMFHHDPAYWHAVRVTLVFAFLATPLKLGAALGVALLLNRPFRGSGLFRGLFYLPSLLGGSVALAMVWHSLFDRGGSVNAVLGWFGIEGKAWVNDPHTALGTLILLAVWQFGAPMVIFLAGLKQVPAELYEAAEVDGAGTVRRFVSVTLPMLSPVIFFNLVLETIHGFQGFTSAFVLSNGTGGPVDSTLMYTLYLYIRGFANYEMGYASAMAWVFLLTIGLVTALLFRTGRFWVHYSDGDD
ncbi:ABC transporter permease [Actinoplanes sp. SE50]|uniref:carbohydrate ABC transporter permease n=1 Tax=unclassified Actinoplanes TaxID=2626549 RepID=UPI00023EBDAC|nr:MULTISPECIES: sugar ABC transporter permease [unclassified Actinoplanes]AEV86272.1 putative ABC transporter permease protein yesP [Actinoplanes sp. SE50/110]ATO84669.1 ABC transporter permease [Actinoplanes sp. SE50]SLM02079.1 ABC transporter permease [Actinoplanes sp. SE50/110]